MKLYDNKKIDFTNEKMFFGEGKNTQRFDVLKYPWLDESNDTQQGLDWKHDEVPMGQDYIDFNTKMTIPEKFIYTRTLQRLIFLDSLQGRAPMLTFGQVATIPELEGVISTWNYFEGNKHSKTYTHNLRNVYDDPAKIFDESFEIPELLKTADIISKPYNDFYEYVIEYIYYKLKNLPISEQFMKDIKKQLIRALVNVNILEGVRFYAGFACIWALTEGQGYVPGTAKNLILICRDENQHLSFTQRLLGQLKTIVDEDFTEEYKELESEIYQMYVNAYNEEMEWVDYLFSKGSYIGVNADICKSYVSHTIYKRMRAIGLEPFDKTNVKNPLPWVDKYIVNDEVETLAQEAKLTNYITGGIDTEAKSDKKVLRALLSSSNKAFNNVNKKLEVLNAKNNK